jgi:diphthamide biosynthesis protein 7
LRTDLNRPTFLNKLHGAGVCSAQWSINKQHVLATGSYDGNVRIWDDRNMTKPLSTFDTGGGVWRIKWHPFEDKANLLLLACMRGGVHILNVLDTVTPLVDFHSHGSENLAYGVDWILDHVNSANNKSVHIGSASFYNRELRVWEASTVSKTMLT